MDKDQKRIRLFRGNCLAVLKTLADNSIDSVVTDPPYGLSQHSTAEVTECLAAWVKGTEYTPKGTGLMGKAWDAWVPSPSVWKECLRVLKPGGHLLAFAGTRSMDLMCMSVRLSGFELRDSIGFAHSGSGAPIMAYCYGSGFPKSLNVGKAIDKQAGVEFDEIPASGVGFMNPEGSGGYNVTKHQLKRKGESTPDAVKWEGWGTALKPAWEPIVLARKPLEGTVAANVLKYGTGAINIEGCRIATDDLRGRVYNNSGDALSWGGTYGKGTVTGNATGRWPANLVHDGSAEVLAHFPDSAASKAAHRGRGYGDGIFGNDRNYASEVRGFTDSGGSAARFFYTAKPSARDRSEGLEDRPDGQATVTGESVEKPNSDGSTLGKYGQARAPSKNFHPTVKPTDLMRYLCRLVTPPNGVVLDPFMGSGSTGKGAMLEGMRFVGIEREPEYFELAKARVRHAKSLSDAPAAVSPKTAKKLQPPVARPTKGLFS